LAGGSAAASARAEAKGFLAELHALKIDLCLKQQGIDTTTPAGKALFGMMGVFAEFERSMIQERVRAGLERARRDDKRLGRPPLAPRLRERIQEALRAPGRPGVRKIAEQLGVNPSTVQQSGASSCHAQRRKSAQGDDRF
jgi:DNA invertase Pin-like site-specific DNA recombinase